LADDRQCLVISKNLFLRSKTFQDLRESIHPQHNEGHAGIVNSQDIDVDQNTLVQFDFDHLADRRLAIGLFKEQG
jgi:hypothetical protein